MSHRRAILIVAVVWAIALFGFHRATTHDPAERTSEFLMDMAHSPAYSAQEPISLFPDGGAGRTPARGAIARGYLPFPYAADEAGFVRAGDELTNPVERDAESLRRGERVFTAWCAACHGAGGLGDGAVTKRGVPPPPSLLAEAARKLRDGEIYYIITSGRKNMPAHAAQVARDDRWKVIHFIRELQEAGP